MRCINGKLIGSLAFCLAIGASWALAAGVLELPANPVSNVMSNGGVRAGGFLPQNNTDSTGTQNYCTISIAGGLLGTSNAGANALMDCPTGDNTGSFFRIIQSDTGSFPRVVFEVTRAARTRVNSLFATPYSTGLSNNFNGNTPGPGGAGPQGPLGGMLVVQGDETGPNNSVASIYGTLRNAYGITDATSSAILTLFGNTSTNGGTGFMGGKRLEVADQGSTSLNGLPIPTLACTAGGSTNASSLNTYVRVTLTAGGEESHLSPLTLNTTSGAQPSYKLCATNTNTTVTAPAVLTADTWSIYAGTSPGTERLVTSGLAPGTDYTLTDAEQNNVYTGGVYTTTAPYYVTNGLLSLTGNYNCTWVAAQTNCATLFIGGQTVGATNNYAVYVANGRAVFNTTGSVTNCSDGSATPADCAAAAAGSVAIAAAATAVVVNTTAVTANSQIFIQEDSSLGTKLSVTCNTTIARTYAVTARTAATSFTITASAAPVTNPACLSYYIVN